MKNLSGDEKQFLKEKIQVLEENIEKVKSASMVSLKPAAECALDSNMEVVKCMAQAMGVYDNE